MRQVAGVVHRLWTIGEDLLDAANRTVGFARRLGSEPDADGVWGRAGLTAAAAADELLLTTFRQLRAPTSDEGFASTLDEAAELVAYLDRNGVLAAPETLHRAPPAAVMDVRMRRVGRTRFGHATYPSPYHPNADVPGATRFARETDNHVVHVDAPPDGARPVGRVPARRRHGRPARRHVRVSRRAPASLRFQRRDPGAAAPRSARRGALRDRVSHRGSRGEPPRGHAGDRRRARAARLHRRPATNPRCCTASRWARTSPRRSRRSSRRSRG